MKREVDVYSLFVGRLCARVGGGIAQINVYLEYFCGYHDCYLLNIDLEYFHENHDCYCLLGFRRGGGVQFFAGRGFRLVFFVVLNVVWALLNCGLRCSLCL